MERVTRAQVIELLLKLQSRDKNNVTGGCAPIKMSLGSVNNNNIVQHNTIVIHDTCPLVIEELSKLCGYRMDLIEGKGLVIRCNDED